MDKRTSNVLLSRRVGGGVEVRGKDIVARVNVADLYLVRTNLGEKILSLLRPAMSTPLVTYFSYRLMATSALK